mmetsp:Transcript_2950/g.8437  ORF Transcript_2950/g.8437 Transcript_2950/m.8437 type:complete len:144 (-) Transcript_2950:144-575(-)
MVRTSITPLQSQASDPPLAPPTSAGLAASSSPEAANGTTTPFTPGAGSPSTEGRFGPPLTSGDGSSDLNLRRTPAGREGAGSVVVARGKGQKASTAGSLAPAHAAHHHTTAHSHRWQLLHRMSSPPLRHTEGPASSALRSPAP